MNKIMFKCKCNFVKLLCKEGKTMYNLCFVSKKKTTLLSVSFTMFNFLLSLLFQNDMENIFFVNKWEIKMRENFKKQKHKIE